MAKILVLNPGSTSTKIAIYEDEKMLFDETIRHHVEELHKFDSIPDQKDFRYQAIRDFLSKRGLEFKDLDAVAARGGMVKPLASGTYTIDEEMVKDLKGSKAGLHASSLAGLIAYELKQEYNIPAFIVDPVVVDEFKDIARISGIPGIERVSAFHALNQKAMGRVAAKALGKTYEECNFVIAHMGGGVTVGAHEQGQVIDVNNGITGEGPMSPERCGSVPAADVAKLLKEGKLTQKDIENYCSKNGGMTAYLKTNDLRQAEEMIASGDKEAKLFFEAMAYQIAKEIGSMAAVLSGKIDGIVLTGGLAYSKDFTKLVTDRVSFMAPVLHHPGEHEMEALALGVLRVLNKEIEAKKY